MSMSLMHACKDGIVYVNGAVRRGFPSVLPEGRRPPQELRMFGSGGIFRITPDGTVSTERDEVNFMASFAL